jgi:hypothetical protein
MTFSNKIDNILNVGISLHDSYINNWALTKDHVLDVLQKFEVEGIAIFGGDVMDGAGGQIGFESSSWHSDKKKDEKYSDFVKRSIKETREYVNKYPISNNTYFILVLG